MGSPFGGGIQQQGPQQDTGGGALGGGIGSGVVESAPISAPVAPPTSSSMFDLMKLVGPSGWGTTDEGGLAMHAYPSSSGVPYAYGLSNMVSEILSGEPNNAMAPDAPYTFPYAPDSINRNGGQARNSFGGNGMPGGDSLGIPYSAQNNWDSMGMLKQPRQQIQSTGKSALRYIIEMLARYAQQRGRGY